MSEEVVVKTEPITDLQVVPDDSNKMIIESINLALEAAGDNVIILIDTYRSGYECKVCYGKCELTETTRCFCDELPDENGEWVVKPGTRDRFGNPCPYCAGDYLLKRQTRFVKCAACDGKGQILFIPDTAKTLPTTGLIMSVGPLCKQAQRNKRIIYGPHSGSFLPMRSNYLIKVLKEHEIMSYLYGVVNKVIQDDITKPNRLLPTMEFMEVDVAMGRTEEEHSYIPEM